MSGRNPNQRSNNRNAGRGRAGRGGRGTTAGRSRNNNNNNNSSSTTPNQRKPNNSNAPTAMKRNGEKGAEAHTVPESTRIKFTKILSDMRENPNLDTLEMPTDLTNTERKFLHTLAMQLGLKSKSAGKGDGRRIIIKKLSGAKKIAGVDGEDGEMQDGSLPVLNIGRRGIDVLNVYMKKFPPNKVEAREAEETGSSLAAAVHHDGKESKTADDGDSDEDDETKDRLLMETLRELNVDNSTQMYAKEKKFKHVDLNKRAKLHHAAQQKKVKSPNYHSMQQIRAKLPAYNYQKEICDIIQNNRVTILSGDTGCGKSTQVPQFVLDSEPTCNIVVTQPRRISAISIAERVANERCEKVGNVVGYNVRLDTATSPSTQLVFLTPGVLLRKFQSSFDLKEYTHIIIDEIHERDKYTEFLMIALRKLMEQRKDLRIVLMSATIQTNELRKYWNGVGSGYGSELGMTLGEGEGDFMPAEICVPGRTFPVQSFYLEDVLQMTGFVDEANFGGELNDLEADLNALLTKGTHNQKAQSNGKGNRGKNGAGGSTVNMLMASEHSLVCVMCNQGGFKCAEELGTHMGMCAGVGNIDMVALEQKVRQSNVCTEFSSSSLANFAGDLDASIEDEYDIIGEEEGDSSVGDDDDERFGMHAGKWDGESPFGVAEVVDSAIRTTLTEEEMLNRYQMMHDDEQIDTDLIMETVKYIVKVSYLDGAILVFLPGK